MGSKNSTQKSEEVKTDTKPKSVPQKQQETKQMPPSPKVVDHHGKDNEHFTESKKQELDEIFAKHTIHQTYQFETKLGQGSYGTVYQARLKDNENSPPIAVKTIDKTHRKIKGKEYVLIKEINLLKTLDHPNIIKLYEVFNDKKYFYICQEYCNGGDLFQKLTKSKRIKEKEVAKIMEQTLKGIAHMHAVGIVHRDLKPDNLLYSDKSEDAVIKIIDFGLSKKIVKPSSLHSLVGTPYYVAPEVLNEDINYGRACDLWSIGVMVYVMLVGYPPFDGEDKQELFENIQGRIFQKPIDSSDFQKFTPQARDFMKKLLIIDPKKRLTASEALDHEWFQVQGLRMQDDNLTHSTKHIQDEETEEEEKQVLNRLMSFKTKNLFHQEVMSVFVHHLDKKDIDEIQKTFEDIDKDKTGTIEPEELQEAMKQHGKEVSIQQIKEVFKNVNTTNQKNNKSLRINYSDFIRATLEKQVVFNEERLWSMFKYFDTSDTGEITFEDLVNIHKRNGDNIDEQQLKKAVIEADPEHKGQITFDDFKKIMGFKDK